MKPKVRANCLAPKASVWTLIWHLGYRHIKIFIHKSICHQEFTFQDTDKVIIITMYLFLNTENHALLTKVIVKKKKKKKTIISLQKWIMQRKEHYRVCGFPVLLTKNEGKNASSRGILYNRVCGYFICTICLKPNKSFPSKSESIFCFQHWLVIFRQ